MHIQSVAAQYFCHYVLLGHGLYEPILFLFFGVTGYIFGKHRNRKGLTYCKSHSCKSFHWYKYSFSRKAHSIPPSVRKSAAFAQQFSNNVKMNIIMWFYTIVTNNPVLFLFSIAKHFHFQQKFWFNFITAKRKSVWDDLMGTDLAMFLQSA